MVQNKLLFEDSSYFSIGGWLYSSTVHIGLVEGVLRNLFRDIIWATDSESCLNV